MIRRFLLAIFFSAVGTATALACSTPGFPPSRFDISQYVFIGEVTGYIETKELVNRRQSPAESATYGELADKTAGLKVKVRQAFYTPFDARPEYEIYKFSLSSGCGLYGIPLDWLKKRYKIGDKVSVVAARSEHVAPSNNPDLERLELRYGADDRIVVMEVKDPSLLDVSSVFDYKAYRSDLVGDPDFEVLKDMRRLSLANAEEKREILDRLTYFPRHCERCGFYLMELFKNYSSDMKEFARFSELVKARQMTDEEYKRVEEKFRSKPVP